MKGLLGMFFWYPPVLKLLKYVVETFVGILQTTIVTTKRSLILVDKFLFLELEKFFLALLDSSHFWVLKLLN